MFVNVQVSSGDSDLIPSVLPGSLVKAGSPQMKIGASLLWHSGQPFGVPDVGNEIMHAHTVTECPSGTQEPCEIEAHRRELTFVMAFHQQDCSQRERKRILGCERPPFIALFLSSLLSISLASCTPS